MTTNTTKIDISTCIFTKKETEFEKFCRNHRIRIESDERFDKILVYNELLGQVKKLLGDRWLANNYCESEAWVYFTK